MCNGYGYISLILAKRTVIVWLVLLGIGLLAPQFSIGVQTDGAEKAKSAQPQDRDELTLDELREKTLDGHSDHGAAFDEGPRQRARLLGGTGNVKFPVTTESAAAQAFINQGVGQLHGFWYLEAERSFRQAAAIDEKCAMAFWGAAMAAYQQRERSQGFIKKAVELRDNVTEREKAYIDALDKYFSDSEPDKKKRAERFLKDLESIVIDYPDDLEAKAFVVHRIWYNAREGIPVASYLATEAMIKEILSVEPLHPVHHYRIHLWDYRHPKNALRSAARCGISAPAIAHMWHMPGHIYSRLHRYEDAIFQQEASARVDHAHMIRDHVMPDEIHNFAHNNEWLIRNLVHVGRAGDAISLAKNMIELPRHPRYNTLKKRSGSASYGRKRLLKVLREFELFETAVELCQSAYLDAPGILIEEVKTLRLLACSATMAGQNDIAKKAASELERLKESTQSEISQSETRISNLKSVLSAKNGKSNVAKNRDIDPKKAKLHLEEAEKALPKKEEDLAVVENALKAVSGYQAVSDGEFEQAYEILESVKGEDKSWIAEIQYQAGQTDQALDALKEQVKERPNEVLPLARLAFLQWQNDSTSQAQETFELLRNASSSIDVDLELFARLKPIAESLELEQDWRKPNSPAIDTGFRPALDSLGPFRWHAADAPQWSLVDSDGETTGSDELAGQPYLLIFYLGHGCLHCSEQLGAFAPRVPDFKQAGIEMLAISTDDESELQKSIKNFAKEMPIRLMSNDAHDVFKKFRAFDDFEKKPLHGTYLVDAQGKVLWQDISYEPFMEHEFLLEESKRLLQLQASSESQKSVKTDFNVSKRSNK